MGKEIPLAKTAEGAATAVLVQEPANLNDKVKMLEASITAMQEAFSITRKTLITKEQADPALNAYAVEKNKEGLPLSTCLIGVTKGIPYVLTIWTDGKYYVGNKKFASLSAAAEAVSGVRRSGWTFWKLPDGRTAKEVFKDT